jgi:hypothetical protein
MRFAPSRVVVVTRETLPLPLWEGVGGGGPRVRPWRTEARTPPPNPLLQGEGEGCPGHRP